MSTDQKGLGGKIKRLFIEGDEASPSDLPPGALAVPDAHPDEPAVQAPVAPPAAPRPADPFATAGIDAAKIDFASVFRAAGLADEDLEQVDRAEQLLKTLPVNLPLETKRQILEGTLQTFKVNPLKIRQSIQRQQRALAAYATVVRQDSDKRDAEARARIETLRAEALKLERAIEERGRSTAGVELACRNQSERIAHAVEFLPDAKAPEKDAK